MKVLQLSDFHLFNDKDEKLHGVCTYLNLKRVVDFIIENNNYNADAIFLTGDVSQDGSLGSYNNAINVISEIGLPVHYIPGNHDDIINMKSVFSLSDLFSFKSFSFNDWDFILMDTTVRNSDSGFFS